MNIFLFLPTITYLSIVYYTKHYTRRPTVIDINKLKSPPTIANGKDLLDALATVPWIKDSNDITWYDATAVLNRELGYKSYPNSFACVISEWNMRLVQYSDLKDFVSYDIMGNSKKHMYPRSFVALAGIVEVLIKSRKPKHKNFVVWATNEILPFMLRK